MVIDKAEIEYRFKRSVESYDENAYAQKAIVRQLTTLLKTYCPVTTGRILEVGCGTGLLTSQLQQQFKNDELYINDLVEAMCNKTAGRCQLGSGHCITGDIEQIVLEGEYDLIVSASTFQWLADPSRTFLRLQQKLKKGGWMVFSTFGKDNYRELKTITGKGLVYRTIDEMNSLLSPYFEIIYTEEGHYVLEFDDPVKILQHIKKTGVNAGNEQQNWTRGKLASFAQDYTEQFMVNGRYPLTYHPQYFICRKIEA